MSNKGLKSYTRQIGQSVGVIEGSVNLNQEDSNLHLVVPILSTIGLVPFTSSLIYNYQKRDETGIFGEGFNLNFYEKLNSTSGGYHINNADGSTDYYELKEGKYVNLETMSEITVEMEDDGDYWVLWDKFGNKKKYSPFDFNYPKYIVGKNGDQLEVDFTSSVKKIKNGKGDEIQFVLSGNLVREIFYYQDQREMYRLLLNYTADNRLQSINHIKKGITIATGTISYETNKIVIGNSVSKQKIQYILSQNRVISIQETYSNVFPEDKKILIDYQNKKTLITDEKGHQSTLLFDENNFPLYAMDSQKNVVGMTFDKNTKQQLTQSASISVAAEMIRMNNLLPKADVSVFVNQGLTLQKVTETDPFFQSVLGNTVYRISGTGKLSYTYQTNGIASDEITAILWGKPLMISGTSSKVKIWLKAGEYGEEQTFLNTTVSSNYELKSLGIWTEKSYQKIELIIELTGNASIEIGGIQLLKKAFGSFNQYDGRGNTTYSRQIQSQNNQKYNDQNEMTQSLGSDSTMYQYEYDSKGNLKKAKTAYGVLLENEYDVHNHAIKNQVKNGIEIYETTREYTADGRYLKSERDELNNQTQYTTDADGKLSKVVNALNTTANYTYDSFDALKQIILSRDGKSIQADYVYDSKRRIEQVTLKNGTKYNLNYDERDNLLGVKMNGILTFQFEYDSDDQLVVKKYGQNGDSYRFLYNDRGQLDSCFYRDSSGNETLQFTYYYNSLGQLTFRLNEFDYNEEEYVYDTDGRLIATYDRNKSTKLKYNNLGEVCFKENQVRGQSVYTAYDTVARSKGSNPEGLESQIKTSGYYMSTLFIEKNNPDERAAVIGSSAGLYAIDRSGKFNDFNFTKDGIIPCLEMNSSKSIKYYVKTPDGIDSNGFVGFWFKPTVNPNGTMLFSCRHITGQSEIEIIFDNGKLNLQVKDYNGYGYSLLTTTESVKLNEWNFFALNWYNREYGNLDVCEYALTLNENTLQYKKENPRIVVDLGKEHFFFIGHYHNGYAEENFFIGKVAALAIGYNRYVLQDEVEKYRRITKDYVIYNQLIEEGISTVNFSNANLYTNNYSIHSEFEIYPLHNGVSSLKGKNPVGYDLRQVAKSDRDRTFNFNKKIKRYAYMADGSLLTYNFGISNKGTIAMRVYLEERSEKQYFFQSEDGNQKTIGLFSDKNGKVFIDFNGSNYDTFYTIPLKTWQFVSLSMSRVANMIPTFDFRICIDGQVGNKSVPSTIIYGDLKTTIGRAVKERSISSGFGTSVTTDALNGQIEMLATSLTYPVAATLTNLKSHLEVYSKTNQYDEMGLLRKSVVHQNERDVLSKVYSYKKRADNPQYGSMQVAKETFRLNGMRWDRTYTTDALGNVTWVGDTEFGSHTYEYDYRGFLVKDNSQIFEYDLNGNITKAGSKSFTYGGTYKDQLTSVGSNPITYDANNIGNPKHYFDKNYTFEGRRLVCIDNGYNDIKYFYDDEGLRLAKQIDEYVTTYYYESGRLITEICEDYRNDYMYDENGLLYGFIYNYNETFYYVRDFLQNILGIVSQTGELVVKYNYSAYGELLSTTGRLADTIGSYNPFKYKGYYYDYESQMYYCKSRYYVPEWCRWLNSDDVSFLEFDNICGMNLFGYCANSPVMNIDLNGNFWDTVLDIGFATWSLVDFIKKPSWANFGWLALDLLFMAIPFATGGSQILKVGNKVDDASDIVNLINKIDKIGNLENAIVLGRNMDRVRDAARLINVSDNIYDGAKTWQGYNNVAKYSKKLANGISAAHNGGWVLNQLRKGTTIIDIGLRSNIAKKGLFYGTEQFVLAVWKYRNFWKMPIHYF